MCVQSLSQLSTHTVLHTHYLSLQDIPKMTKLSIQVFYDEIAGALCIVFTWVGGIVLSREGLRGSGKVYLHM